MTHQRTPLTQEELLAYGPNRGLRHGSTKQRYYCPIHKGIRQRSFQLDSESGHFHCFRCENWGYLEHKLRDWIAAQKAHGLVGVSSPSLAVPAVAGMRTSKAKVNTEIVPARPDIDELLRCFRGALPGSPGQTYLESERGIDVNLAQLYGLGYARASAWPGRSSKFARVCVAHTSASGVVVNVYGRAIGRRGDVPKDLVHDHLRGPKQPFNGSAMLDPNVLYITEGAFDALSMIAAGYTSTCAIFGLGSFNMAEVRAKKIVICFDADKSAAGGRARLYYEAVRFGKIVYFLDPAALDGFKDINELWVARGRLDFDGGTAESKPEAQALPYTGNDERTDWAKVQVLPRKAVSLLRNYPLPDDDSV